MTAATAEPEIRLTRSWTVTWERPRRGGWPNITHKRIATGEDSSVGPRTIRVRILQTHGAEPSVEGIDMRGRWLGTQRDTGWQKLSLAPVAGIYAWAPAPDWVHELAGESLARVKGQLAMAGP